MKENNEKKKNYNSKRKDNKGKDQREYERNVILCSMGLLPGLRYHILFVIHLAVTKDRQQLQESNEC